MARVLEVSRSGYYAWEKRRPSARSLRDAVVKDLILKAHHRSRKTYGPRRLQAELAAEGVRIGRDAIARLRKEMGLRCVQEPGTVWTTDLTSIPTDEGWLYLAGVKDLATREIVGSAMDERMTTELVQQALRAALRFRTPQGGCIHHSDRGSQYCAHAYREEVDRAGMVASMSRKGTWYDNAPTESFWGHLKQEFVNHRRFRTRAEAKVAIQEYITIFYNRMRRHSALGNVAPSVYAETYYAKRRSA